MKDIAIILFVSLVVLASSSAGAVEVAPRITDKEIVERLTRLEEGQKTLNKRIDGLERSLNKRIDDLDKKLSARIDDTNKRIDDTNKRIDSLERSLNTRIDDLRVEMNDRFNTLEWMLGLFITISLVTLGFVLRMQWQLQRRQTRIETTLETHKDELAFLKSLIEKLIPPKEVL